MTLFILGVAFVYTVALSLMRLNDALKPADPSRYRHPMHRAHPHRRTVPDDWTPLPQWVRVQLAPTVHRGIAIEAGVAWSA